MARERILTHREREVLRRRGRAGWSAKALAVAHGISVRTAYRHLRGDRPPMGVRIREAVDRWAERRGVELREGDAANLSLALLSMLSHEQGDR